MKVIFTLALGFLSLIASGSEKAEIKVCTVLHENKSSKCLTSEKQSFPTTKLLGISKIKKGQKTETLTHQWNGSPATEVLTLERGRILISTYEVPAGHSGVVAFSLLDESGIVVETKNLEVARGPLSLSAHEQGTVVPVPVPVVAVVSKPIIETVNAPDLPSLESLETDDTAEALSAMAKEGGDIPDLTEESLEETKKAVNAQEEKTLKDQPTTQDLKADVKEISKSQTGLIWKRLEVHGAFVTQSKKGSSYTVIPYYAPEFRTNSFFGFGARIGATEWKQEKGKNIRAFEGDIHLSVTFQSSTTRFTLQPAYGYHSWSKFGSNSSFGGLFDLKMHDVPLSIVGGVHMWTYKKIDYRLATVGLGLEF